MKTIRPIALLVLLSLFTVSLSAQNAKNSLNKLYDKYNAISKFSVEISYTAESEMIGFKNVQEGRLTVEGEKYILKFGATETWLGDGKAEYIGTKEEDHSELIIFCPGENFEVPVNYRNLFTFYKSGTDITSEGDLIKVVPKDGTYKYALLKISGNTLDQLTVVDEMDMSHIYTFSKFNTNPDLVVYSINPRSYVTTIDERQGCK